MLECCNKQLLEIDTAVESRKITLARGDNPADEKQDRRQSLILAAYHAIAEKGFEGLRVRDVAAQVGINGATLHHYFATKEALIQAVMEYVLERLRLVGEAD